MKVLGSSAAGIYLQSLVGCSSSSEPEPFPPETRAVIHKATGPDPADATRRLIESLGGIETVIGQHDIVVLKPNAQWWAQGMTNTDVMAAFIEMCLSIPGFDGEIIMADNHQAQEDNSRAWTTKKRNGRYNYNELIAWFNSRGYPNVTKYHWHDAGANPMPLQEAGHGDQVVTHPSEGDGYIWPRELSYTCPYGNRTVLSYPVFTSSYSGVTVDLKNGAFRNGEYTGQPIKFINFPSLNHHGRYAGVTAAVKNLMGVVDMSCGWPAPEPAGTYNTHHIGATNRFKIISNIVWKMSSLRKLPGFYDYYESPSVFRFQYTGGVLGAFMHRIRRPDLNILTAIRSGWGSRVNPEKTTQTDTVLASTDPVALDFWASANVLLPATRAARAPENIIEMNDPTIEDGPLHRFLQEVRREMGGTLSPELMDLVEA